MLHDLARVYRDDLFGSVLPFWMKHSPDPVHGGFFTCLDRDGTIYDPRKYLWLNGRQVWMLAKLHNEGIREPGWLDAATQGALFLRRYARDSEGRVYFSLTADGRPASFQRKPYGAVFVMLGWLEYSKATGEGWARTEAVDLFWKIRHWIAHPEELGRPALEGAPRYRQLADVMVVTSMALELAAVSEDPRYDEILLECLDAALGHWHPGSGVLLESVPPAGEDLSVLPEGRLTCPGHTAEVCWFLLDVLARHPDPARQARVLSILESALEFGWDREHGGLYYFADVEGRPLLQLEASMKLWWPHTEALYALVRACLLTGEKKWCDWLARVHEYTYRTFPDPEFGEWYGYCDRQGRPSHSLKGNSYKGCFHVPRALWLSLRAIEAAESKGVIG